MLHSSALTALRSLLIAGLALLSGCFPPVSGSVHITRSGEVLRVSPGSIEGGFFVTPMIHPGGNAVVFQGCTEDLVRIWTYHIGDDEALPITDDDYVAVLPSYSPDGSFIAFSADRGVDQDRMDCSEFFEALGMPAIYWGGDPEVMNLYVVNEDGTDLRQLTFGDNIDTRVSFHPDGEHVVFSSNRGGNSDPLEDWLYTMPITGEGEPLRIPDSRGCMRPVYSPDGEWLYFWADDDGRDSLHRMPAAGGNWERIPGEVGGGGSHGAFVDAAGEWVYYHASYRDAHMGIYRIPVGGGEYESVIPAGYEEEYVGHASVSDDREAMAFDVLHVFYDDYVFVGE